MSKLLLDEHPLMVMPNLAKKIGLNEAIILQQIHYWNEINKRTNSNFKDGHYWTFNSVQEWREQFPFWSGRTIQRTITNLEKMKLVITGNYNKLKIDRTKWYRIDYKVLSALEESPFGQNGTINVTEWRNHLANLAPPLPETNSETNKDIYIVGQANDDFILLYYSLKYQNHFGKEHPPITSEQLEKVNSVIEEFSAEYDAQEEDWENAIDEHFNNLPKNNNGSILSFCSGNLYASPLVRYLEAK